jgi:gliding motility-associated-like protein
MKKSLLYISLLLLSLVSYAQGEANIWYFGNKAGLDFNTGTPVVLTNGQMTAHEGCATISNGAGQLLMYTNGVTVWNKNHQIMPNGTGLLGGVSSTQSAIIVPHPTNTNIYYIFTTSQANLSTGIHYSEVDLSLQGGLGDVTVNKNILLIDGEVSEKLTAVKNKDETGYWVIMHGFLNNSYFAFQVMATGVNVIPVTSNVGPVFDEYNSKFSYLKFSPDGSKLANSETTESSNGISFFDFDNSTGLLSNYRLIPTPDYFNYGLEFSISGNLIYTSSERYIDFDSQIHKISQYDLTATDVTASEVVLHTFNADQYFNVGALQLAPDNKIYVSIYDINSVSIGNYISRIENPDILGTSCNLVLKAIDLSPNNCILGLPQFIQSYFNVGIFIQNNCVGEISTFSLSGNQVITSATWDFGDGSTLTAINPTHIYASPGTYTVSVTATGTSGTTTKTKDIVISTVPTATKPQDILVCDTNNDGLHNFDLITQNTAILNGQDPNLYAVNYFANATDYANKSAIASPNNYINTQDYQQQTIIAEVSNKANGNCKSTTSFNIDVFDSPKPNTIIPKISSCDNTSIGTDADSRVAFDLTQRASTILNGQSASQFLLSYYRDATLSQVIATPNAYANTNALETIYVKMTNKDNVNCFATTSFQIEVLALPVISSVVSLKQCDDNIDGFSVFNLEEAINKISSNAATETIAFFRLQTDAQNNSNPITNTTTYTNQTVSSDVVYVRVTNFNGCFRIAQLNLIVSTTQIPLSYSKSFTECDDAISGTNTDGITSFDFSSVTNDIQNIFPVGQLLDIRYFRNLADALAEKNAIADISNYRNIGYPNAQKIYIRVDSRLNNDCLGLGSHITLNVEGIPIVHPLTQIHCDDNQDGKYGFDTSTLQIQLLNGLTNVNVTYFDQNNVPLPSPLPNPFNTTSQTLKVVVINNTTKACSFDTTIQFIVDDLPEAFSVPTNLTTVCDDEADPNLQDGKYAFDTSTFQNTILGGQTGMIVNYFDGNNNPLSSPLPNPFVTVTQNVKVEVINPINIACTATITLLFTVNQVPKINLLGDELVCSNLPTFTKVLDAGLMDNSATSNYNYVWSFNGNPIVGEKNYTLTVNKAGLYTVEVKTNQGCYRTRTITVTASDIAKITDVNIVDLAESNSISITISGAGDYVYSLDEENGAYQKENIFSNVSAGIHTVFVKDLNGCGVTPQEVAVLGIPNFFTPNDDGHNDFWNIKGINASFNANTIIYIFDRYGKLLKQISPLNQGWDGKFNNQQMPATDYWYSMQLEDGRVEKGHFALKR